MGFIVVDERALRTNPVYGELLEGLEAKAQAKGKAEGVALGEAGAVLAVLDERRIALTADQRDRILLTDDLEVLGGWLRAALRVSKAGELFE